MLQVPQPGPGPHTLADMLRERRLPQKLLQYEDMAFCRGLPEVRPAAIPSRLKLLMVIGAPSLHYRPPGIAE